MIHIIVRALIGIHGRWDIRFYDSIGSLYFKNAILRTLIVRQI